jgi:hypothetical protein
MEGCSKTSMDHPERMVNKLTSQPMKAINLMHQYLLKTGK